MNIKPEYQGKKTTIYSVQLDSGESPAVEYLKLLKRNNGNSHKAMVRRYVDHANLGRSRNKKHEHPIINHPNLYVMKTKQGARILNFIHPNGGTVLTHGYNKGDNEEREYAKAEQLRAGILNTRGQR